MGTPSQSDCEQIAATILRKAKAPHDEVWLSTRVMRALYGPDSVACVDRLDVPACMLWLDTGPQMVIAKTSPDPNFDGAHELGHLGWDLFRLKGTRAEEERGASMIGAAIAAPAHLVRRAYAAYGENLSRIAAAFRISLTSATLRLGEVLGDSRAVVTRNRNVIRRGFFGVDDRQLLLWRDATPPRGIVKIRLHGAPFEEGRVVLRVAPK